MELPVTLVIKAPNQRIGDQTVDCMLDWTVRKLKQHLTNVYPSKPNEKQQKLIYSGKLLQDHLTLKEVLREHDDGSNKHTVHLVCAASSHTDTRSPAYSYTQESHSRQSSSSSSQSSLEMEGVRYRGHRNASPSPSTPSSSSENQHVFNSYSPQMPTMDQFAANMAQYGAGSPMDLAAIYAGMMPGAAGMASGAAMGYSPEQYMWLQQMYAQYMAQYMQYYQQAGYQVPPNTPVTPQAGAQPHNAADNGNQQDNAAEEAEDLDEEFRQRDWLDYLYTFSRFMVLLGIVYFYSSMTRFLMVAAFFLVVYAYQMGWFYLRRRREEQGHIQQQQRPNEQNIPQRQENAQQNVQQENGEAAAADPADVPAPPPQPPQPGVLQVSWTFLSTFFTSLFPAPPPAVNAN